MLHTEGPPLEDEDEEDDEDDEDDEDEVDEVDDALLADDEDDDALLADDELLDDEDDEDDALLADAPLELLAEELAELAEVVELSAFVKGCVSHSSPVQVERSPAPVSALQLQALASAISVNDPSSATRGSWSIPSS